MPKRTIRFYSTKEMSELKEIAKLRSGKTRSNMMRDFAKKYDRAFLSISAKISSMKRKGLLNSDVTVKNTKTVDLTERNAGKRVLEIDIKHLVIRDNKMMIHY